MNYEQLISKAKEAGFEAVEIYKTKNLGIEIMVFSGSVEKNNINDVQSYTIRGIYNGKMTAYTTENEKEEVDYIINKLKENASVLTSEEEVAIYQGDEEYPKARELNDSFSKTPINEKIELLKGLEKAVKAYDSRIVQVAYCVYGENIIEIEIINSYGLNLKKETQFAHVVVQAIALENNQTQSAFEIDVKLEYGFNIDEIAKNVATRAIALLNAKPVASKSYPIVFENRAMADLMATFASMFSGEAAVKKITPLLGKEKQVVFGKNISIVDDPLLITAYNYQPFDDEGVASYRKEVVAEGEFKTFLHNLKTAKFFKTKSTGNGYKRGTEIGVSHVNLCLVSKGENPSKEELINTIEEGLLITDLAGLHSGANPINGDFSAQASGFLIEDGKISKAVSLIVVSGNFVQLLNNVEAVGNDFKIFENNVGISSIKVASLPVSGL